MLDRQHLLILKAIDECGTLTGASEQLFLTQSALSHAIKKLEQAHGVSIWEKEGRKIRLTQAGRLLLSFAKRVLPQFEHVESQMAQIKKGERGTLRIGMECHPCYQWLLKVVQPFISECPDVDVDIRQRFQFGALGALLEYDIDMIITPDPLQHEAIQYQSVFDYEHVLVVSNSSALANKAYIEPEDIAKETLFSYPVEPSRLDIFSQFLTPAGAGVKRHKTIETTEIMMQMVAAGRGVAALPRWLVESFAQDLAVKPVSLGRSKIKKSIHLGTRVSDENPDYINEFMRLAKSA